MPVLLITGAGRGIGAATARLAAARGYVVAVNYKTDQAAAAEVVAAVLVATAVVVSGCCARAKPIAHKDITSVTSAALCGFVLRCCVVLVLVMFIIIDLPAFVVLPIFSECPLHSASCPVSSLRCLRLNLIERPSRRVARPGRWLECCSDWSARFRYRADRCDPGGLRDLPVENSHD